MATKAGQIVIDITAGTRQFVVDMEKASGKIREFGQAAHGSVSGVQAVSGTLRVMEGNVTNNLRAAERWVASLPGVANALKVAFPVVGAVAFAGIVTELGTKVRNFFTEMQEAPVKISAAFRALNDPLRATNDALAVSNARLENDISKLDGKRPNNLKVALLEAVEAADKLADSLDKDLASLNKLVKENNISNWKALIGTAGTEDITKEFGGDTGQDGFIGRVNGITDSGNDAIRKATDAKSKDAAQTALSTRLLSEYGSEIQKVNGWLADAMKLQAQRNNQPRTGTHAFGADTSGAIAGETPADQSARIATLQGAIRQLQQERDSVSLTGENTALNGKKQDLASGAEDRKKNEEELLRLTRELGEAKAAQLGAIERIDAEEANEVHNLAMTHQQTQANLELVEQIYDAKRLTEYNKLAGETVKLHLDLASALKKVTTEEAAVGIYGQQFLEAAKQMEERAKSTATWAKEYNRITAETDSQAIRHRVNMAGVNGNPNDPLGTLATQQALERADIETRYEEKLKDANTDLDRSIALREKELELQKLQDEMEERTAAARHKNLTDFMREMQGQTKTAGDILYNAANSELDSLSNNLAKLATGQHKKTTFGKDLKSIGDTMVQASMKSMLQKGLGAVGKKFGIKKQDGQSAPTAWYVQLANNTPIGPNPLASLPGVGQLPPALGKSSSGGGILGGIGGWLGGLLGKGGGGGAATAVDNSITFMAAGGDADPGHVYGVAEAGEAELISPKTSSRITPLSKLTGGGNVEYHIDARGADLGAENRVSRAIEAAHNSAVSNAQRADAERAKRTPQKRL